MSSFPFPPLDESEIVLEAANLPHIFRGICTSLGVTSPLLSSEVSAIIEATNFQPCFKGKHGVTKLRYQFQAFSQSFHGTYREDPPKPDTILYAIIFRGDQDNFDLQTVKSCTAVILRDHAYDIFRMQWPEISAGPVVFQHIKRSHGDLQLESFPEILTLELQETALNIRETIFIRDKAHRTHISNLKMKSLLLIGQCKISII
jgi:hypothetical protein